MYTTESDLYIALSTCCFLCYITIASPTSSTSLLTRNTVTCKYLLQGPGWLTAFGLYIECHVMSRPYETRGLISKHDAGIQLLYEETFLSWIASFLVQHTMRSDSYELEAQP